MQRSASPRRTTADAPRRTAAPAARKPARGAAPAELAKLSRPRLFRVTPRERLFRLLDEKREHPVIWIAGPPGAGKSALVASYLESRKPPGVWFQVDAGDSDPATLFYYLGLAAQRVARGKGATLPLFKPEYQRDLGGFTRRFFREFFARMPVGAVLVFDNFQDARVTLELRQLLAEAMGEIPAGVNVIVLSRGEPLPEFARLAASQLLVRIGWEDLRFTVEESRELLGGGDAPAETLHDRADGWAAGLVLMREHVPRDGAAFTGEAPEGVFHYFAGEVFNRVTPENQHVLLATAVMPRFTVAMAEALCGAAGTVKVLEYLYRRQLFLSRRGTAEPVYEYHQLFRSFLLARARTTLPHDALARLARHAGELLEARGWTGSVVALYRDAEDWPALARVLAAEAPALVAQGRGQSLREWIAALPAALRDADPRLGYWEGIALAPADPAGARERLERAHHGYAACGDAAGQLEAAAAVIDSHYLGWDDFRPLDRWIAVMDGLLAQQPAFADAAHEARVLASLAIALVYRQPFHPAIAPVLERLHHLVDALEDVNVRVPVATRLMDACMRVGDFGRSGALAARIRALLGQDALAPVHQATARLWLAYQMFFEARLEEFDALLREASAIADANGFVYVHRLATTFRAHGLLARGDARDALPLLAEQRGNVDPGRRVDAALCAFLESWTALCRADLAAAERHARAAADLSLETGSVASSLVCHSPLLVVLDATGQHAEAQAVLHRIRGLVAGVPPGILRFHALLCDACVQLRDDADALETLAEALAIGRTQGYLNTQFWWPPMMAKLAARALQAGIETDYVKRLVLARGLAPPDGAAPAEWPWAVEVRALGGFEVRSQGGPLAFTGKAQKKPLELLKALVALGGRGVEWPRLAAILWPDASGDAAKVSFDSTLYRLRKLLGTESALALQEGKLSLDPRQCRVDVWRFEGLVQALDARLADPRGIADLRAADESRRLLDAYGGHFLGGDEDAAWSAAMRDRLRAKLVRAVTLLGRRLQEAGEWRAAADLYARALEHDNLAEDLYRQLMICHRERGEPAQALEVYRRCRQLLSIVLSVPPSPETEAIRATLPGGASVIGQSPPAPR
jgi:ATP/maltotriose-dependent transcriptional regulator MalT/DNA-binding SARP family transcriptional activator